MTMKDSVELWRSVFELLKSVALVFIFVALLAFPEIVHRALTGVGVAEFDLWGFKGKTALAKVATDLQEAQVVQAELTKKLTASDSELKRLAAENNDLRRRQQPVRAPGDKTVANPTPSNAPASDASIHVLLAQNSDALKRATDFRAQADKALMQNAAMISSAKEIAAKGDQRWIVIYGSDVSEEAALTELKRATAQGFDDAFVCLKRSRYRAVVEFGSLEAANQALPQIRTLSETAKEAYVVNLGVWCPKLEKRNDKLFVCS
jgi:hypothetical protein